MLGKEFNFALGPTLSPYTAFLLKEVQVQTDHMNFCNNFYQNMKTKKLPVYLIFPPPPGQPPHSYFFLFFLFYIWYFFILSVY